MPIRSLQPTSWLAQRLSLSVSTIERLRARGDRNLPPYVVIGSHSIRYDEEVVEVWLNARMRGPSESVADNPTSATVASAPEVPAVTRRLGKRLIAMPAAAS